MRNLNSNNLLVEAVVQRCCEKGVFKNFAKFTGKHLCYSLFFNKVFKKETLAQVFSCEFCEISKNSLFTEYLWATVLILWTYLMPSIQDRKQARTITL